LFVVYLLFVIKEKVMNHPVVKADGSSVPPEAVWEKEEVLDAVKDIVVFYEPKTIKSFILNRIASS